VVLYHQFLGPKLWSFVDKLVATIYVPKQLIFISEVQNQCCLIIRNRHAFWSTSCLVNVTHLLEDTVFNFCHLTLIICKWSKYEGSNTCIRVLFYWIFVYFALLDSMLSFKTPKGLLITVM